MSTTTATKSCAMCAHWKSSGTKGECRRHAPQSIVFKVESGVKYEAKFPITKADDWCGDYTGKTS